MTAEPLVILAARPLLFADAVRARRRSAPVVLARPRVAPRWAVVLSGAGDDVAAALAAEGFAAVAADPPPGWRAPGEAARLAHAFAALAALVERPDIAADRVVHVGVGAGASVAALSAYAQVGRLFTAGPERFAAHLAIGAAPVFRLEDYRTTGAPVTLVGTPADPLRHALLARDLCEGGSAVAEHPGAVAMSADRRRLRLTPENDLVDERTGRRLHGAIGRLRFALGIRPLPAATPADVGAIVSAALSHLPPRQEQQ